MIARRILACFLSAQIATGARQNIAHLAATDSGISKIGPLSNAIKQGQDELEKVEKIAEEALAKAPQIQEAPVYADAGLALELGEKKQGSHSIKGSMTVSLDSTAPKPTPDGTGHVPAHGEIKFTADSNAQAKKLVENIEKIIEKFLGEEMRELREQLPQLTVEGSSIKLIGTHLMPYDEQQYNEIQEHMKTVTRVSMSHDIYMDLDMWVKNPTLKLWDVYTGMKGGVSARVSEGILQMLSGQFEQITSDEETMAPVKAIFGDDYETVIEKLKNVLKGNEETIPIPGFDKIKEQLAEDNPAAALTFNEAKAGFEEASKAVAATGNPYAVAVLNLVQQAAAANLRFSSTSVSMFGGAVKVEWTLQGMTFFNIVANAAQGAGADKLIYGDKKPEDYNIPGVVSEAEIEKIGRSGAFAKSCHVVALAMVAALMNWVV